MVVRLIFFDIDGTLVPDTSTGSFIAKRLGSLEQMAAAERAYEEGRIDNGEVCAIDAAAWRGYRRAEVESWLDELPLIAGIRETVDACRGAGMEPHLASLAWTVVGEYLCRRFGFAGCCGPVLEEEDGIFTGRVKRVFDEYDKRDYALRVCAERGIDPARCIAVGSTTLRCGGRKHRFQRVVRSACGCHPMRRRPLANCHLMRCGCRKLCMRRSICLVWI